jgi:hypothetical protein
VARPMPLAAPVTNATFPSKLLLFIISLSYVFIIDFGYPVLLVANLFHPVCHVAAELFLNSDRLSYGVTVI